MKKILAVMFSVLCISCLTLSAFAEPSEVAAPDASVSDVSGDIVSDETVGEAASDIPAASDVTSAAPEASSEAPEQVESADDVNSPEIIVNYSASHQDLGSKAIGVAIWVVCGVLLFACLILFVYKFIQYRNSK